jgi:hypothetical protein
MNIILSSDNKKKPRSDFGDKIIKSQMGKITETKPEKKKKDNN